VKLREYQQTGLNWLVSLQSRRLNGILADGKHCGEPVCLIKENHRISLFFSFFFLLLIRNGIGK
jgi:hypothetical protein